MVGIVVSVFVPVVTVTFSVVTVTGPVEPLVVVLTSVVGAAVVGFTVVGFTVVGAAVVPFLSSAFTVIQQSEISSIAAIQTKQKNIQ